MASVATHGNTLAGMRYSVVPTLKCALLVLDRKRAGFLPEWGAEMLAKIKEIMGNLPHEVYEPPVKVVDDPTLREALRLCKTAFVDVMVVVQPTISDGRLAPVLAQQWDGTLVLWATPEKQEGSMISANSLVGTHMFAATCRQLGRPFEFVFGNLDWAKAERDLLKAIDLSFAAKFMRQSKIMLIGHQAPGFLDFHPNPFVMNKTFGVVMQHVSLQQYFDTIAALSEEVVAEDVAKVQALGLPVNGVEDTQLPLISRSYLALKQMIQEDNFDALAIRCWPELPTVLGVWPYMALARLATEGFPIACEGDVDGSLGCLAAKLLRLGAVYLSDWLEHDTDSITLWHGGMAPFQLSEAVGTPLGPCIGRHFNNGKSGVLDASLRAGMDVTIFRFWVCDDKYHLVVFQGTTIAPSRHLMGNHGVVKLDDCDVALNGLDQRGVSDMFARFDQLLHQGMPHHVCVVEGRHAQAILNFARRIGNIVVE